MISDLRRSGTALFAAAALAAVSLTGASLAAGGPRLAGAVQAGAVRAETGQAGAGQFGAGQVEAVLAGPAGSAACPNGYVGLTYDDGPTVATRQALLGALRAAHLRATFFEIGANAQQNPDLVRAALHSGMWIGNHSFTHPHLPQIGEPAAFTELADTQRVLRSITGRTPELFRPPFGETSEAVRADAARLGLLEVLWTVDSRDWAGASTAEIVAAAATLQPGGIILMHDWAQASLAAVPQIARGLADRGLCAGRIAFTPRDIPGVGTIFHAVAVAP
jgi:peptidoglycan/xylan/chitin deacetylase (PgdA/CDA1 family)